MNKKKIRCIYCDRSFFSKNVLRKFCSRGCYKKYRRENPVKETLCWSCKNTSGRLCSWFSSEMKPVCGWTAKPSPTSDGMSYFVISCPNYKELSRGEGK